MSGVSRARGRSRCLRVRVRVRGGGLGWTEKSDGGRQRGSAGPGEECADVALDSDMGGLGESGVCVRSGTRTGTGGVPSSCRLERSRELGPGAADIEWVTGCSGGSGWG